MSLRVLRADAMVTVQDRGRTGLAHLGVPLAGALDAPAADLANRLVGNHPDCAVLEVTLLGLTLSTTRATTVAVTGAPCDVAVDGRARAFGEPVSLGAGARLTLGPARRGLRSYLAVAGGVAVPPVLGSRSTDTLALVGPPVVAAGTVLPVGEGGGPQPSDIPPSTEYDGALRVRPGPRADWFVAAAWELLTSREYAVRPESNRIGLRLTGPVLRRAVTRELPSEGLIAGAVQVPPDGRPVVLLADHPTTGGYPVLAVVEAPDLARCAQLRPGDPVRFSPWRPAPGAATDRPR